MNHWSNTGVDALNATFEVALCPRLASLNAVVVDHRWLQLRAVQNGSRPRFSTWFRFAQTRNTLVLDIIASCEQLTTRHTRRNDPLYEDDVVEVFIDPVGSGRSYLELQASPAGVLFDAWVKNRTDFSAPKPRRDLEVSFNRERCNGPTVQVLLDGKAPQHFTALQFQQGVAIQQWRIRFEIPFAALLARQEAAPPWRANVFRIQATAGEREYQAWRPTGLVDFHRPDCFGALNLDSPVGSDGIT